MLDPDISTHDARRLLSVPDHIADDDAAGLKRRTFLQMVGWGVGGGALLGTLGEAIAPSMLPGHLQEAWAGSPIGPTDGIVVLLGFEGGNDFLNTFVPYTNGNYYSQRPGLAIPANQVLPISSTIGLNNRLGFVKSMYDRGEVAIVQGVGYPNPDLSHFSSMAYWMAGRANNSSVTSGWVGRWLDGRSGNDLFTAATIGGSLPLHLIGEVKRGTAIPPWGLDFGGDTDPRDLRMYDGIRAFAAQSAGRGALQDALAVGMKGVIDVGQEVAPIFTRPLPENRLQQKLTVAARLINANLGLRVIDTSFDGFDTHSSQPASHDELMVDLNNALFSFFNTLDDRFKSRVTIMTYSEFGRTSYSNDSQGTDHGTASAHMLIGSQVRGGLYGQMPSLANLDPWERLAFNVDFRSMYTSVLDSWMGGGASSVLGGNYENLNLFRAGPGQGVASGSVPPSVLGDYVSLTPYRLYDSRNGTGGRTIQLGAGTVGEVQVLGLGGVPTTGVTAVAVNVVSVAASETTSMTVWPTGEAQHATTNVKSLANRAVPSLVILKVGQGGRINIVNDNGSAHCVVDVMGYFRTTAGDRLQPITPVRALDTRNGTGGRLGAVGATQTIDVSVVGLGGIPNDASAVVLNLTAVQPTAKAYATLWPTGVARPLASSVNFEVGQTVPNMAIAKVGTGGKVSIYNHAGNTNYVVDIVGYLSPTAPGRHFPLAAARLLDTRTANGAPMGPQSSRRIQVLGVGGVPASGVGSVVVTLTAVGPTANSFVTAWPDGDTRPPTANLNPLAGAAVTNMCIVKLGASGAVQVYNQNGSVHLVVDVVGYFSS